MTGKVLFTASSYDHLERFHKPYIDEFRRLGFKTHVACAGAPERPDLADKTIRLPLKKRMLSLKNFSAAGLLRRAIEMESYDLVMSHTALAAFFSRLAMRWIKDRPASAVMVHGYLFGKDAPILRGLVLRLAEKLSAKQTDLLLVMNGEDLELARRYSLCSRIVKVPGVGVDFSRIDAPSRERTRGELGFPEGSYVLLNAAEFSARKSQRVLVKAMQFLPGNFRLILAGTGDKLNECRKLAVRLGVSDKIAFPGRVEDIGGLMRLADAYVSASRSEGLPFSVVEALHLGLPVAASCVKGHTDLVEEGATGALYPYGDAKACAQAVLSLSSLDAEAAARRAEASVSEYSLERVLPQVMEQYLSLLRDRED